MSGFRGVAEVYEAQWTAHLNSAVANAFHQTLAEKHPDPVARIGRLLTARVDGPAPQFVPPPASPGDPLSQAQSDAAYNSRWSAHINAMFTQAWKRTFAARPADPVVHLGRLLLAASTAGAVTALEAENASLRAQLERERALRATDPNPASSATSEEKVGDINLPAGDLTATLQAENVGLRARVQELTLENEELKHGPSTRTVPGEKSAASPALQALREKTQAVLAKLEAAKPSTAAAGTTASLPDGLKDFTPLAEEPEIKVITAGLHDLELPVARSHTSEAALAALRAEAEKLAVATQAKIAARTAEARRVPTAEELEASWAELMPRVLEQEKDSYSHSQTSGEEKAERAQKVVDKLQAAWERASVDDKPRLLRKTKKEEESFVPLISECAAAILAGNRDFQKIYHAVYHVIRSGEADGIEAAQTAIAALGQAVRGDPKRLQQRDEAAEPATLLADAAGARPAFAEVVRCLSEATGARLEMASLGEIDQHGREQTGLKATKRIVEKAALRPGAGRGRADHVCDVVRAMLVAKDMRTVGAISEALCALQAEGLIEVRRVKDRFAQPSGGGWRDLMVNLVVLGDEGAVRHVCEVQVAHEGMLTARKGLPAHEVYAVQRNAAEFIESCGLEAELRRAMVQALKKEGKTHVEILSEFEDGWVVEDAEWAAAVGSKQALLKGLEADEEGRLIKVKITYNEELTSLPESVGECTGLQELHLEGCSGLVSLPERLGECKGLLELNLRDCSGLVSLPDLSGLAQLTVEHLPNHLQPWKASGYKVLSL